MFDYQEEKFVPDVFNVKMPYSSIHDTYSSGIDLAGTDHAINQIKYGKCEIQIPKKSFINICGEEVFNPFYFFLLFVLVLWYF